MKHFTYGFLLMILFGACSKSKNVCSYNSCDISAPASEVTAVENYLSTNSISATRHCGGIYYIIDAAGSGKVADMCSVVLVKYKGQLSNGSVFDQSTAGRSFNLKQLIDAWKKGIMLIRPGGKIRMWVPPSLAYGDQAVRDGSGTIIIPANSMLVFEIELVSVL